MFKKSRSSFNRLCFSAVLVALCLPMLADAAPAKPNKKPVVKEKIVIDKIWSSVRVGFCLLTHGQQQYIAYYNSERRMVVGMRDLSEDKFTTHILPSKSEQPPKGVGNTSTIQGWDSHNYITMAVDSAGYIHLSGNMHVNGLTYFRSTKPNDITTLVQIEKMVGDREDRCTYPKFMRAPDGSLLFHYRDGWSGRGDEIYNAYDVKTQTWSRFFDKALVSGQGKRNAYQRGPMLGPDGWYHLLWMWRETFRVETNNNISYARSKDLKNWETAGGEKLKLPMTRDNKGTIIDPVPVEGGLHNSNHNLAFDSKNRAFASYFKHDENGDTQVYLARFEKGAWKIRQVSKWQGKHLFRGGGSGPSTFGTSLSVARPFKFSEGKLGVPYRHWKAGHGVLVVDEETLTLVEVSEPIKRHSPYPPELTKVQSDFPGMRVVWSGDRGKSPEPDTRYVLRWETLGANRDRPRKPPFPENADLVLYKIGYEGTDDTDE